MKRRLVIIGMKRLLVLGFVIVFALGTGVLALAGNNPLKIDPKKTALLVIDVAKDMMDEGRAFHKAGTWKYVKKHNTIENIARAMDLCEKKGILVIRIWIEFRPGYEGLPNRGFMGPLMRQKGPFFIEHTEGAEPAKGLEVRPGQLEVIKRRFNSFYGTELESLLRARDIDTLLITGVTCAKCVNCTIVGAVDRDYNVIALRDAMAGYTDEECEIMFTKVWPGWRVKVVTVDEALGR
jgi:nicotinamidase-related amidase